VFSRKIIVLAAGALLTAGAAAGQVAANAEGNGAGACTVTGSVTSSGIGLTPSNNTFTFNSVAITCTGSDSDDNGAWTVNTVAGSTGDQNETCAGATNIKASLTGSGPEGLLTGALDSSTSHRAGANVIVNGTITAGGEVHTFHGHLIFQPTNGVCDPASGSTAPTTTANIITGSTAAVTE